MGGARSPHFTTVARERRVSFESLEQTQLTPNEASAYAALAVHEVKIAVGSATLAIRFSRASAAAAFGERFGDMLGLRTPDAVFYAVAVDGAAYFWQCADCVRYWPHDLSDEVLVFFADNVALHDYLTTSGALGLHAAVIARPSAVAALVGSSTAGKTTTALAAVRNGFTLYSDERCILADGLVVPFLRAVSVRADSRTVLLRADSQTPLDAALRRIPAGHDASLQPRALVGELAGGPPRPLGAVFLIENRAATPAVEACALRSVLPALLRSMVSRDTGLARAERILRELQGTAIFRLQLGTPDATARLIEATLDAAVTGAAR